MVDYNCKCKNVPICLVKREQCFSVTESFLIYSFFKNLAGKLVFEKVLSKVIQSPQNNIQYEAISSKFQSIIISKSVFHNNHQRCHQSWRQNTVNKSVTLAQIIGASQSILKINTSFGKDKNKVAMERKVLKKERIVGTKTLSVYKKFLVFFKHCTGGVQQLVQRP